MKRVLACTVCGAFVRKEKAGQILCSIHRGQLRDRKEYLAAYSRRRVGSGEDRARRYSISIERVQEILAAGCYYQGEGHGGPLEIDHDHRCCPVKLRSCGKCVRGALCRNHNRWLGVVEKHRDFIAWALEFSAASMPQMGASK